MKNTISVKNSTSAIITMLSVALFSPVAFAKTKANIGDDKSQLVAEMAKHNLVKMPFDDTYNEARVRFIRHFIDDETLKKHWENDTADSLTFSAFQSTLDDHTNQLFAGKNSLSKLQFTTAMNQRLAARIKDTNIRQIKQTGVRFDSINYDKDDYIDLGEFQRTGMKSYDAYDADGNGIINEADKSVAEADAKALATNKYSRTRISSFLGMPTHHSITGFAKMYQSNGEALTQADYLKFRENKFFKADSDGNQKLDLQEYTNEFMGRVAKVVKATKKNHTTYFSDLFSAADSDKNSVLTQVEFKDYQERLFHFFDANQDNLLNEVE